MTYTTSGVTVLPRKLEQSAFLEERGGRFWEMPVTARAQLSALQLARLCGMLASVPVAKDRLEKTSNEGNMLAKLH